MTQQLVALHAVYNYRMNRPGDESSLFELWKNEAGWGSERAFWNGLMLQGPSGPAQFAITETTDGSIVGQIAFLPSNVLVDGRLVRAVRMFAAIMAKNARQVRSLTASGHPVSEMYRLAVQHLPAYGFEILYSVPNLSFVPALRMLSSCQHHAFQVWSITPARSSALELPPGFTITEYDEWNDVQMDGLQRAMAARHRCFVYRSVTELQRRIRVASLKPMAVHAGGVLVGLVLLGRHMITDVLTIDGCEALRASLVAACLAAARSSPGEEAAQKLHLLAPGAFETTLRDIGFEPDVYRYPLVVQALNASLDTEALAPAGWYLPINVMDGV